MNPMATIDAALQRVEMLNRALGALAMFNNQAAPANAAPPLPPNGYWRVFSRDNNGSWALQNPDDPARPPQVAQGDRSAVAPANVSPVIGQSIPYTFRKTPDTCPLCLNEFEDGDTVVTCRNGHVFHAKELETWRNGAGLVSCPSCRTLMQHRVERR